MTAVPAPTPSLLRLAVLADYAEEHWPGMDLCAEMLAAHAADGGFTVERSCPPFRRRWVRVPVLGRRPRAGLADRLMNRHWDYPRFLGRRLHEGSYYHIVDHSYAHLAHVLPAERTGVYCHDLDAFRCLLAPAQDRRPWWFRALARRTLTGLQQAAVVFCSTHQARQDLERHGLAPADRFVVAPYGPAAEFRPAGDVPPSEPFLLHVGSCIPRKRIDVLLAVFAALRRRHPALTLVQVGGTWTAPQEGQLHELGIGAAVRQVRGLTRAELADYYRGTRLMLLPSAAEGFGLPVLEALACGTAVVATDLPSVREVGGDAATYCPVADLAAWTDTVDRLLTDPSAAPPRAARLAQAAKFSWAEHARIIGAAYRRLTDAAP